MAGDEIDNMKVKDVFQTDPLLEGRTEIESSVKSVGDLPVGGITEWEDTFSSLPTGFVLCDGATISDPLSSYNGSAVPDLNTNYLSIGADGFTTISPDVDDVSRNNATIRFIMSGSAITCFANINLPNESVVTACIVYGNAGASAETYTLEHGDLDGGANLTTMATANIETADSTITNPTIDNSTKSYRIRTSTMDAGDEIYGALITYTPRFKFIIRIR